MRRGLMGLDPEELPKRVFDARLARLRAAMQRDGLDAVLVYTNLVRPAAVCWLTGFTPYWIDSILLVPRTGEPVLASALSKRVADWMRTTCWVGEIINTPKPGTVIGQRLAADACRRVGVLELDALPAGLYDDLQAAAPGATLADATATFAGVRSGIDAAERDLIARADALALAALAAVNPARVRASGEVAGLVEQHARLNAAEEAYIAVAPDLDADRRLVPVSKPAPLGERFAVRASIAYKGSWVRRTRTFARDAAGAAACARGQAWLDRLASSIEAGKPLGAQIGASTAWLAGAKLKSFLAESCIGSYPLEVTARMGGATAKALSEGTFLVLTVELLIDGIPWVGAAPAFAVGAGV